MISFGCNCGNKPPRVTSTKTAQQIASGQADSQSQGK